MKKTTAKWLLGSLAAALPMAYLLSPGPVIGMCERMGFHSFEFIEIAYAPLIWLSDQVDWIEDFYESWVGLWLD